MIRLRNSSLSFCMRKFLYFDNDGVCETVVESDYFVSVVDGLGVCELV